MKLAKDCLDVGVQTNNREAMLAFWGEEVGLPYDELLKVGGGNHQHRHSMNGSIFKLNHLRDALPSDDPTGYSELLIGRDDITAPRTLLDPDGNRVTLVPRGHDDVDRIGIVMTVRSIDTFTRFYREVLQLEQLADNRFLWGTTVIRLNEDASHAPSASMRGVGYRYITVQVWDVDAEHAGVLERGGTEGRAPVTLGTTARISFITDPDNNWIEVSQRASLTGTLD
ncbi:MAG: VOC family protein [Gammaproteobacteria bacterium]|nr:VOC family protein [Gammaproteobacteria bacterium]